MTDKRKKYQHFGQFMAQLRIGRGLTQVQLSDGAGVSGSSVSRQETSDVCRLRAGHLESIVNYLNYHQRLTPDEIAYLKVHGRLRENWEPPQTHSDAPALLEVAFFQKHFPGDLRKKTEEVFEAMLMEMGAKPLLTELLGIAAKRNIHLGVSLSDDV